MTTIVHRARWRTAAIATVTAVLALVPIGTTAGASPTPTLIVGAPVPAQFAAGNEPSFTVVGMVPPSARHAFLTVGTYRSAPGAVNQLVVYSASPGGDWAMVGYSGETGPDVELVGVADTPDGSAVVFGAIDTDDGRRPATWLFDGATLQSASVVGDPATPGRVAAGSVAADGTWRVVVERREKSGETWAEVAALPPGGSWTAARLPTGDLHLRAKGIASSGTTVVVTGDARDPEQRSPNYEAAAYVSADKGVTFTDVNTSAMAGNGPSALGPVVAHTDGTFYAASCSGRGFSYATSRDGRGWEIHPDPDPGMSKGGCLAIAVDEGGGVWLVRYFADLLAIRLVDDVVVQGVILPRDDRVYFTAQYLDGDRYAIAVSPTHVGFVGAQHGGARGGTASRDSEASFTDLADGIPSGHPAFSRFSVVDDAGSLIQLDAFPVPLEHESGGWMESTQSELHDLLATGALVPSAEQLPRGQGASETTDLVVDVPTGQVAFGVMEPSDPDERQGSIGDLGVARRAAGQPWPALTPAITGAGAPVILAAAVDGSTVIAVGGEVRRGVVWPLVGLDDGTTFRVLNGPIAMLSTPLSGVCRLADGRYLAVGGGSDDRPTALVIDLATETLTAADAVVDGAVTGFTDCATAPDGVVVVATTTGGPSVFVTTDGTTFTPVAAVDPLASAVSVDAGVAGIAIAGRSGIFGGDGFVAFGPTIAELAVLDAPTMEGPGAQEPMMVVVRDSEVHVLGTVNARPVVWPVSLATT